MEKYLENKTLYVLLGSYTPDLHYKKTTYIQQLDIRPTETVSSPLIIKDDKGLVWSTEKKMSVESLKELRAVTEKLDKPEVSSTAREYVYRYGAPEMNRDTNTVLRGTKHLSKALEDVKIEIKKKTEELKKEYSDECKLVINHIADNLVREIQKKHQEDQQLRAVIYGTRGMQHFAQVASERWGDISSDMSTMDIDIAVEDKTIYSEMLFHVLVGYAEKFFYRRVFDDIQVDFYVGKIEVRNKGDIHTIDITIMMKHDNHLFFSCKEGICDVSDIDSWEPHTTFSVVNNLRCQTPEHYICGIVDKLFNSYLNPRIVRANKSIEAAKNAIGKILTLNIPQNLTEHDINRIEQIADDEKFYGLNHPKAKDASKQIIRGILLGEDRTVLINKYFVTEFVKSVQDLYKK